MSEIVYVVLERGLASASERVRKSLLRTGQELNVHLRPLHPGVNDEELRRFYIAEASSPKAAAELVRDLRSAEGVEAAYVKPPDALP